MLELSSKAGLTMKRFVLSHQMDVGRAAATVVAQSCGKEPWLESPPGPYDRADKLQPPSCESRIILDGSNRQYRTIDYLKML